MRTRPAIFKWRQTGPESALVRSGGIVEFLSLRDVEEPLEERGLNLDYHFTSIRL